MAHGVSTGLTALVIVLNPVVTAGLMILVLGHRETRRDVVALGLGVAAVIWPVLQKL